ncbi:insulinase family protein, partial [bacterium]
MTGAVLALLLAAPAAAYETFSLPNGLQVLLVPDHSVPVVTMGWGVPTGKRQEARGRSGFAHLFEHLTFQGSANVPRGGFDKILERFGTDSNAFTAIDRTYYYARLPAHAWTTALWIDADRLSSLDISSRSLRNQIDVVKEERRQNVDGEAYAPLLSVLVASRSFSNWANAHDTYGSFADLEAARLADARAFFLAHYAPREIRLALVGDFEPAEARAALEKYLGWIPNRSAPAAVVPAGEPARTGG